MSRRDGPASLSPSVYRSSASPDDIATESAVTRPDSRPTLAHIKVPVLLLVGMDDPPYAVEMQKMMHKLDYGSRLAIIPGAAHAAIIEKPDACDRAIESFAASIR